MTRELMGKLDTALGLLPEEHGAARFHEKLSEQEAFRKIQKLSMDKRKKMAEIAEAIILTDEVVK